jgi:hypothetical protein
MRAGPALLAAALALAAAGCGGAHAAGGKEAYVRANEDLLESLPRFPGAQEVGRESSAYYEGDSADAPPAGYTTRIVYELPRRVPQRRVIDFYVRELRDWHPNIEYTPGVDVLNGEARPGAWGARFTRDSASVGVNTDNLIRGRRFEVGADHRGAAGGDSLQSHAAVRYRFAARDMSEGQSLGHG